MIRNRNFSFFLDSKSMTKYAYGLLNNVYTLKIPIKKNARSLNISMAVAITLSEALRQNSNL